MPAVNPSDSTPSHPAATSSTDGLSDHYDFIIIGGGTAGLVVAARLTEDPKTRVLVIEAGANRLNDPNILTPGLAWALYDNPDYDWCFPCVPQKELNGRQIPQTRGKVLGGSSCLYQYQMVYTCKLAVDAWEKFGNPGWNWSTMLPYLRKFHTYYPPGPGELVNEINVIAGKDEAVESTEGPIQTAFSEPAAIDKDWYEAWRKIMTDLKYDDNDLGGMVSPTAIDPKTRTRSFAGSAYYSADISSRPNLQVVTEALVEKIVFDKGIEVVASGVQFLSKSGDRFTLKAQKEVILSAGVINTPQILELSGIGDAKLLNQHGIEVLVDNPNVGENFQDHDMVPVSFEVADGVQSGDIALRDPTIFQTLLEMYEKDRSGPLGQLFLDFAQFRLPETFGPDGKSFIPSLLDKITPPNTNPISAAEKLKNDVTLALLSDSTIQQTLAKIQFNIAGHSKITEMSTPKSPGNYFTIFTSLNYPFSRGSIHIASPSPTDYPIIDPKYLSHPMDLELLARHVQFVHTLVSTPPLAKYFKQNGRRIPDYAFTNGGGVSLDVAKRIVREHLLSNCHPVGTCMMGKRELGGVVDERLRVFAVKGLRVVDASIFPIVPRGNIISSVFAVAERAADLIKEDWKGK